MLDKELIGRMDFWKSEIDIEPLEGGITNHNYIVSRRGSEAEKFVVRLGLDIPVHQILRFNEVAASKAAYHAGLSPAIRHVEEGALVMDYVPAQTLTPELIRRDDVLAKTLDLVKRCHREIPEHLRGASVVFWVFHVIRDYAATLTDGASSHQRKLPELLESAAELEVAAGPYDIVFGHNDLLAANFLDDGNRLWLIDWEYAGFNTPLFDLGGLASNNELSVSQEQWMLENYFDAKVTEQQWMRYQAMKTASLLRETMWSMVSEQHSTIDFDYRDYTAENLQRFEKSLQDFRELKA